MGLSFHDEPSLVEAVSSLRFNAVDDHPNPNLGAGSISQDWSLGIGLDDPNADQDIVNIGQERGDNADIGKSDGIQMIYR